MHDVNTFRIDDMVRRGAESESTFEYNCDMRRLLPWKGTADTKRPITEFGMVWVEVRPGSEVDAHEHDEEEAFLVISGRAELELEGQTTLLDPGDVAYIPRFWTHQMKNPFEEALAFVDIYWDWKGRPGRQSEGAADD